MAMLQHSSNPESCHKVGYLLRGSFFRQDRNKIGKHTYQAKKTTGHEALADTHIVAKSFYKLQAIQQCPRLIDFGHVISDTGIQDLTSTPW